MLLLGGAVVRVSVSGASLQYVRPGLRSLLIIAGLLLIAIAVMTLWHEARAGGQPASHDGGHEPRVGWLLLLPVVGLLVVAPPALGSFSAVQSGSLLVAGGSGAGSDYAPLPTGDPVTVGVLDYASRAVYDSGRTLAGRTVRVTGFIAPGADGQPMLGRIVVSCCAADGRPVKVALSGDVPVGVPADTWVAVTGTYEPRTVRDAINDAVVPFLAVTAWQQVPEPAQPYE